MTNPHTPLSIQGDPSFARLSGADSIARKLVNAHRVEATLKKGGQEIGKAEAEVSKDERVSTVKSKGKTSDRKEFSNESVYDKQ